MRVGVIMLSHESNTFIPEPVTLESFQGDVLLVGEVVRSEFTSGHHEMDGFFVGLEEVGVEAVPLMAARVVPGGVVTADTYAELLRMMHTELDKAGRLDGLLVAPHGASVSEKYPDMDGHWLSVLRDRVGADVPIISTLDPHANLSEHMVEACDGTIAYRSNPHLDQRQRGLEAARLMARTLRGEVQPVQAGCFPPMAITIERQATCELPCKALYDLAESMLQRPGVLSYSIILGFPYADVEEMGSAFIVITDDNMAQAQACADELGRYLWEHRHEFLVQAVSIEEALDIAYNDDGPVCLLDMGDNIGGGSPGDGTLIAQAVAGRPGEDKRAFVCICDPGAVEQARQAGPGRRVSLLLGGKCDTMHGPPIEAEVTVRSMHEGRFTEAELRHGGLTNYDMGLTAVVKTDDGLTVMLTSLAIMPFSLRQLTSCDLDPTSFRVMVAKGVHAPVAAYGPVCKRTIRVNTPGITTADMEMLPFKHRRKPMFPFERETVWTT